MVGGDPDLGRNIRQPCQAAAEVTKARAGIAVAGAEAGQVDIAGESNALRLDEQHRVARGMARQVECPDRRLAKIPGHAVLVTPCVGSWCVEKITLELGQHLRDLAVVRYAEGCNHTAPA